MGSCATTFARVPSTIVLDAGESDVLQGACVCKQADPFVLISKGENFAKSPNLID